jgi:hypothetical protein
MAAHIGHTLISKRVHSSGMAPKISWDDIEEVPEDWETTGEDERFIYAIHPTGQVLYMLKEQPYSVGMYHGDDFGTEDSEPIFHWNVGRESSPTMAKLLMEFHDALVGTE